MDIETADRIQVFWDEMADFHVASSDAALTHLLQFLANTLKAQNVSWLAGIRMHDVAPDDPLKGWRPRAYGYLNSDPALAARSEAMARRIEQGNVDAVMVRTVANAWQWRSKRLVDMVSSDWFEGDFYRFFYLDHGQVDAIWAGCPLNPDTEIYFGIYRALGQPMLTEAERDCAGAILRGLKWFYRQLLLSYGFGIANESLTETERAVLQRLLTGQAEKAVAWQLDQSPNTTHVHVKSIYRKFGIRNRAMLMALWLGRPPSAAV